MKVRVTIDFDADQRAIYEERMGYRATHENLKAFILNAVDQTLADWDEEAHPEDYNGDVDR